MMFANISPADCILVKEGKTQIWSEISGDTSLMKKY